MQSMCEQEDLTHQRSNEPENGIFARIALIVRGIS